MAGSALVLAGKTKKPSTMIRSLSSLLPSALRAACQPEALAAFRNFRAVADVEINLKDRETLKKYVGVRDHLSKKPGTKAGLVQALTDLLEAVKILPESSDYRRAVEATSQYRLKVCEANDGETAIEEVLDAHMEELIAECKEEMSLVPLMNGAHRHCALNTAC